MTAHFDWRENQTIPGLIVNPGTGPVRGSSREHARANIEAFVADVLDGRETDIAVQDTGRCDEGRFVFVLRHGERASRIDMPGIPLDEVRYVKAPGQNIFDFPRLYENGSSWAWCYAVEVSRDTLLAPREDDTPLRVA